MRVLTDENVPMPLVKMLRILFEETRSSEHELLHVYDMHWGGTEDAPLYERAAAAGFDVVLTNDGEQLERPDEVEAIAKSGLHRVEYSQRHKGLAGLGVAISSVCAGLPRALSVLQDADGQRLVRLFGVSPEDKDRFKVRDPSTDPPRYWPQPT